MEVNFIITTGENGLPVQEFNGQIFHLYPRQKYFTRGSKSMHMKVWTYFNGTPPKGYDIHHRNENQWDNRLENLELKKRGHHIAYHSAKRMATDQEFFNKFRSRGIEAAKEWHKSPEGIAWHSERGKKNWENPEVKTLSCHYCGKEYRTIAKGRSKYCHHNCNAAASRKNKKLKPASELI